MIVVHVLTVLNTKPLACLHVMFGTCDYVNEEITRYYNQSKVIGMCNDYIDTCFCKSLDPYYLCTRSKKLYFRTQCRCFRPL